VRSAKADSTAAAADSASNVRRSRRATVEPTEATCMETATETTATMEAPSTAATVSSGVCCGTERHESDTNY
jgi:hypothetical protein